MTKRKNMVCAAALAAAGVAFVLCNRPDSGSAEQTAGAVAQPEVAASQGVGQAGTPSGAQMAAASTNQTPTVRGTLPYVLTSAVPFDKPLRLAAESLGAKTVSVVSRNALLIEADETVRKRLAADGRFEEITEFLPSRKVQPALAEALAGGAKAVDVSILSLLAEDRARVIACLTSGGGEMLKGCINEGATIRANLPAEMVSELAARGDVRWMEKFEYPHLMNDIAVTNVAMNVQTVWNTYGLTGAGQYISTSDSGIDTGDLATLHKDLRNRVKDIKVVEGCVTNDVNGHGTHTAGSIVGDGTMSDGRIRGTAHGANLYAWFCSKGDRGIYTPTTMEALYTADGAWTNYIHSASWGGDTGGEYDSRCVDHDTYVWKNPEFLPVFSAGNAGSGGGTIGSPAASKNVLTVGATQNLRTYPPQPPTSATPLDNGDPSVTAEYSSRGPCQDGRTKPDVASPGTGVLSTRSYGVDYSYGIYNDYYAYDTGTSMACPLTAGAVALVRQWLIETNKFEDVDGKRPTAALMKAVIMGGAKDAAVPNNEQGWGRVDLAETLFPTGGRAVKLIDRIPFEQGFVTNIVIETTNAAPLDVQLVWVDYPGSAIADQSAARLVNDIDLTVEARVPGEPTLRYGNGGDEPDTLNNAEVVRIAEAAPTKYVITVNCKTILHDYTEGGAAALYIRGAFDPDAVVEEPAYVRLKTQDRTFMSLDRALKAITNDNETVEILDWVSFDKPVTLANGCTIVATNDDASAAYVVRPSGALLTVATNATVKLENVVFANSQEKLVAVEKGGRLTLGPKVDLGIDVYHLAISTEDADGFELAGALTGKVLFHCAVATALTEPFGTYSCDYPTASACAGMIVCADDEDRETRGYANSETGRLVWKYVSVPLDEASGYFVGGGVTNAFFRMEKALALFQTAYGQGNASEFIARRSGNMTIPFEVGSPLTIRGEGEPRPVLMAADTSGFRIYEGGALTISNVVVRGYEASFEGGTFIEVNGGELTLDNGTMLDGIVGRCDYASGVVDLFLGTVTMLDGSAIVNCKAEGLATGTGMGGAIYSSYDNGCTLNLFGGMISDCYASTYGGGVYVDSWGGEHADVNLSGGLTVAGNASGNFLCDDIHLATEDILPRFKLVGDLNGAVGIRYSSVAVCGNGEGEAFMSCADGLDVRHSATNFFNDTDAMLVGKDGGDGTLVWQKDEDDGTWPEDEASAHVYLLDSTGAVVRVTHYYDFFDALAYMTPGTTNRIEMYLAGFGSEQFDVDAAIPMGCQVTLTSREPSGYVIARVGDAELVVPNGASLTLTNIVMRRAKMGTITKPYINVDGGSLTLAADAEINGVIGNTSCDASSVTVQNHGTFTMLSGSEISHSYNYYNSTNDNDGVTTRFGKGGGVLLAGGTTAYLRGGVITDCGAARGGGIYAMGGSTVYLSGDMSVTGNKWLEYGGAPGGDSNLWVEDPAALYVDGELTGKVGAGYYPIWTGDTNFVAKVSTNWAWTVTSLTNSAAHFVNDATGEIGAAVSNKTETLIVWCGAVKNGVYTNEDNVAYVVVGGIPLPKGPGALLPELGDDASPAEIEKELKRFADPDVAAKITTPEDYEKFRMWAQGVEGGVEAVAESDKAYVSYAFGTKELLEEDPAVEITQVEKADGGLTVSVVVKDGEDPVEVASEKVAQMFEAATDVNDWSVPLALTVTDLTKATADEVLFTVNPADNPAKAFIRLKY